MDARAIGLRAQAKPAVRRLSPRFGLIAPCMHNTRIQNFVPMSAELKRSADDLAQDGVGDASQSPRQSARACPLSQRHADPDIRGRKDEEDLGRKRGGQLTAFRTEVDTGRR